MSKILEFGHIERMLARDLGDVFAPFELFESILDTLLIDQIKGNVLDRRSIYNYRRFDCCCLFRDNPRPCEIRRR